MNKQDSITIDDVLKDLLTIQIISGIFIYLLASLLTKNESMYYVYNSIKTKFQKK